MFLRMVFYCFCLQIICFSPQEVLFKCGFEKALNAEVLKSMVEPLGLKPYSVDNLFLSTFCLSADFVGGNKIDMEPVIYLGFR